MRALACLFAVRRICSIPVIRQDEGWKFSTDGEDERGAGGKWRVR